jgi:hypothetical protein
MSFIPYWESFHTHTHCMSWVIYLKFLSAGKIVLIKFFTLNYIFAYFWNAIWLLYQLIIHAYFEDNFMEQYFSANFPSVSDFQCKVSRRTSSWVQTRVAQSSGRLNDTSGSARFCWVIIWQWPSGRVSCASGQIPYRF